MISTYNGGLTREKFLFYEIRIVAALVADNIAREEITERILRDNLFQFPTEKLVKNLTSVCFKRIDALQSGVLVQQLAHGSIENAKQINLYAMMKYNRIVWDFMTTVIGEKYRTQESELTKKDMNLFFFQLQEQNDTVRSWSDSTVAKIKQVLIKSLVECVYLDSFRSEKLNPVLIVPELEDEIRVNNDLAALPAFNCFR